MAGLNKVSLIGHLGKDPEVRSFQNGGKMASFSLATSEAWKDKKTGERKEKTEWHRISVLSDGLVGVVEKYLKKGSRVYLEGRLETRSWKDKDGQEKYSTEVVLRGYGAVLNMLDAAKAAAPASSEPPPAPPADVPHDAGEIDADQIPY